MLTHANKLLNNISDMMKLKQSCILLRNALDMATFCFYLPIDINSQVYSELTSLTKCGNRYLFSFLLMKA